MSAPIYTPFPRQHLGEMGERIREVIYSYANRASVAEVMGVLEIVKLEVYEASREEKP